MIGWTNNWNTIIRKVIWPDHELKVLMKVPPKAGILQFDRRYFIKAGFTNALLTDEVCRIIYSETPIGDTNVPNIKRKLLTFDIYVKDSDMYNVGDDRLVSRLDLIADRLDTLLRSSRYVANTGYRFWPADGGSDVGTRTIGYSRKVLSYYFLKVY